jgi:hypothetical protein
MAVKKSDLIKILVEEYGYEKEDLKFDAEGRPYTNAKLQGIIDAEIKDAEEAETNKHRVVAKKSTIKDDDKIVVMSGSMGTVVYRSELSGRLWKFTKFGQMDSMPYSELVAIQNRFSGYFADGWIVVLDTKVQEEFNLTHMYKNILTPQNIEEVFNKPAEELSVLVDNLPEGMKATFVNKAQELYEANKIDNYQVIRLIEDKFKFSLSDNAPISDIALEGNLDKDNIIYIGKE